ncbi:MAG: hypothetical protein ACOCVC_07610 [Spirochaeta sp.]
MKNREYLIHLLAEISNYILEGQPTRMVISLHQEKDGVHLCVIDSQKRSDEEIAAIHNDLNTSARPELAEYYGSMGGSDLVGKARLNLIGWQVKHADVSRTNEGTKIDLWLGGDKFDPSLFSIPQ